MQIHRATLAASRRTEIPSCIPRSPRKLKLLKEEAALLTELGHGHKVTLWGELTPRGNMVHQGVEREDGVHAQLVLGSLKSSQDFRRTY